MCCQLVGWYLRCGSRERMDLHERLRQVATDGKLHACILSLSRSCGGRTHNGGTSVPPPRHLLRGARTTITGRSAWSRPHGSARSVWVRCGACRLPPAVRRSKPSCLGTRLCNLHGPSRVSGVQSRGSRITKLRHPVYSTQPLDNLSTQRVTCGLNPPTFGRTASHVTNHSAQHPQPRGTIRNRRDSGGDDIFATMLNIFRYIIDSHDVTTTEPWAPRERLRTAPGVSARAGITL